MPSTGSENDDSKVELFAGRFTCLLRHVVHVGGRSPVSVTVSLCSKSCVCSRSWMRSNVVATVKYQCVETAVMLGMTHAVSAEPGIVTFIGRHIW